MRKQTQRGQMIYLLKVSNQLSDPAETGTGLMTSVTQHSVVTSPPGYTMRVRPEPSRYAKKCFSLILLTIRKLIFTRTPVRSIINQKSVIRNIKPVEIRCGRILTEGTDISVNCPGFEFIY